MPGTVCIRAQLLRVSSQAPIVIGPETPACLRRNTRHYAVERCHNVS